DPSAPASQRPRRTRTSDPSVRSITECHVYGETMGLFNQLPGVHMSELTASMLLSPNVLDEPYDFYVTCGMERRSGRYRALAARRPATNELCRVPLDGDG
ncbi:hypothetical protein, partial [Mycobacterium sp.]|uniref:hypothetical protein n=1 Tax=Mycobacterium sp. TaxID=1785 RepID=UPI003C749D97